MNPASPRLFQQVAPHAGGPTTVSHRVPPDPAIAGTPFYSQALVAGVGRADLTNSLDGILLP